MFPEYETNIFQLIMHAILSIFIDLTVCHVPINNNRGIRCIKQIRRNMGVVMNTYIFMNSELLVQLRGQ